MKASPKLTREGGGFNSDIAAAAAATMAIAHAQVGRLQSTNNLRTTASAKLEESFLTARNESIFSTEAAPSIAKDSERNGSPLISGRGGSTTAVMSSKVSKRSFKKSNKTPIKVLSADTTNFRALVHQYTAKPTSPSSCQSSGSHLWDSHKLFMRPHPTRSPPPFSTIPGLPTLDTSASLLGPPNQATPLQGYSILSSLQQSNPPFDPNVAAKHGLKHNINHIISEIHPCLASNNPSPNPYPYLNHSTFVPSRTSMPSPADGGHLRADFFTNKLGREAGHPQGPYSGMFADASSLKQASNIERFLKGG